MVLKSSLPDVEIPQVPIAQYALEKMEHFGNSVALVDPYHDQSWTFSQLRQQSIEFALKLRSIGVEKGDVVGLVVDFHPNCCTWALGIILCKATLATGNINATTKEVIMQMKQANAKFCICEKYQLYKDLVTCDRSIQRYTIEDVDNIVVSGGEIYLHEILASDDVDRNQDPLFVAFTSGSTGEPKAIAVTDSNFVACLTISKAVVNLEAGNCMLTVCRQVHMFAFWSFFMYLVGGVKHIIATSLTSELFQHCLERHRPNGAIISDLTIIKRLSELGALKKNNSLSFVLAGGSPIPKKVLQNAAQNFNVVAGGVYGCSESGFISCTVTKQTPFESVGMLCPNVQLKVIDVENGAELGPGKHGELCVKSPGVFKGYLNNKEATEEVLDECGWLRTGDLGYYDEQGVVYVVDRIKQMIKSQGSIVFPAQLEEVLLSHPGVAEAVVVRTAHPDYNEAAKAFVVKKVESLTKQELLTFYNSQVAEYQQLFGGLEFIDHIPKIGLGKPDKSLLKTFS